MMRLRQLWLATLFFMGLLPLAPGQADEAAPPAKAPSAPDKPVNISGRVTLPNGKAATRATVYLIKFVYDPWKITLDATTHADAQGKFSLSLPAASLPATPPINNFQLVAYQPGYAVSSARVPSPPERGATPLALKLTPPGVFHGTVRDSAGKAVQGASVRMWQVYRQDNGDETSWTSVMVPNEVAAAWGIVTDAHGDFTVTQGGREAQMGFKVQAPGFGESAVYRSTRSDIVGQKGPITLFRQTTLHGQAQCDEPDVKLAGLRLVPEMKSAPDSGYASLPITLDETGHFTLKDLPPGTLHMMLKPDAASPTQVIGETNVTVQEGHDLDNIVLKAQAKPAVQITGQVVDSATGQPLKAVIYGSGSSWQQDTQLATSGADGRYTFYSAPGALQLRAYVSGTDTGSDYITPEDGIGQAVKVTVGTAPVTVPDFTFKKGMTITVQVVDDKGGAVHAHVSNTGRLNYGFDRGQSTDESGHVTLRAIDPDKPLTLQARTTSAFSDNVTVNLKTQTSPVKLVVRAGVAARLVGRVLNDKGQPVANAKVTVLTHMGRSTMYRPILTTDARGHFQSAALEPQYAYGLQVAAPQHRSFRVPEWPGERGKLHDFGTIVLVRRVGFVEGHIVDRKGHALAGARVWSTGQTAAKNETQSDAGGHFKLEGLDQGACWVFAETAGYQLAGQSCSAPATAVQLVLPRMGEPQPKLTNVPLPPPSAAAMQHLVHKILAQNIHVSASQSAGAKSQRTRYIHSLARLDPVRATEISQREGGAYDDTIAEVMGNLALQRNVVEAAACFDQIKDVQARAWTFLQAARQTAPTRPAQARILAQHALVAARRIAAVPYQVVSVAQVASLMNQLHMPGGRLLLDEAVVKARNFALTDWEAYARGFVAEQICDYDLETALALVNPIKDVFEHQRHLGNIAAHLVVSNSDRALEIVHSLPENYRDAALVRVCYRAVLAKPQLAAQLAATIKEPRSQAQTYMMMAERLAPQQRVQALGFIDKAVSVMSGEQNQRYMYMGGSSAMLAVIAETAKRLGHPGVPAMLLRAIALSGETDESPYAESRAYMLQSDTQLAVALARVDRSLAKSFWMTIAPLTLTKATKKDDYMVQVNISNCALAALIIDPALCERYLDQLQKFGQSPGADRLVSYALGDEAKRRELAHLNLYLIRPEEDE